MPLTGKRSNRPLRVAILGDAAHFVRPVTALLAGKNCEIIPAVIDLPPARIRELQLDLCIIDLIEPAAVAHTFMRRISAEIPIIAVVYEPGREFEFAELFDVLQHPIDPDRLHEDLAYLRTAARHDTPPPLPPTDAEIETFSEFLVKVSGLHFDQRNRKILERGVARRMRVVAAPSVQAYYAYLCRYQESRHELKKLVALLTIGETSFFRYEPHFAALTDVVIPELIERNRATRRIRIWSAGCSSGEEVYSLAILFLDRFPQLAGWDISILGTDISKNALAAARKGVYRDRAVRNVGPERLSSWFVRSGSTWAVAERPRSLVRFDFLNLQGESYPDPKSGTAECDMIFCRNVMIYFRPETSRAIVGRLHRALRPGGFLFLGHAETLGSGFLDFKRCQHQGGSYYRAGGPPEAPSRGGGLARSAASAAAPEADQDKKQPRLSFLENDHLNSKLSKITGSYCADEKTILLSEKENNRTSSPDYVKVDACAVDTPQVLLDRGFVLADQGRFSEALQLCQKVLLQDDLCARGYLLRGLIYDHQGDSASAAEDYRRTILLDIKSLMAHYHLGQLHWRARRRSEAIRSLHGVVRMLRKLPLPERVPDSGEMTVEMLLDRCLADLRRLES